ncbi:MAG: hypothetical protein J6Z07_08270 [Lachnospiraceae bacterium]|nr:hypothetical protein [Lachnospiraceae bacterium]MBP5565105.1 hypothetical protein [Lachnospiraceae bacterium]
MSSDGMRDKINVASFIRVILIVAGVLILSAVGFFVANTQIHARAAFRDAKNVYLALSATEIEYYAAGQTIYDPTMEGNLAEGVRERVEKLADNEGTYKIVSYDVKNHRLTGLQYNNGNYYVDYTYKKGQSKWEVKYMMTISRYDD